MVCSTPITPAAARTGESHSRPQTWTGKFPAIFCAMALSWSAPMSNCGRFSWLHSEPCSLFPVGLGRNWYFLLQPQKKTSAKPWCDGVKSRHQQRSPPHRCSLFHIHHMLIYHIPPSCRRKWSRQALSPALLAGSVYFGAIESSQNQRRNIAQPHCCSRPQNQRRNKAWPHRCLGPQNQRRNEARSNCYLLNWMASLVTKSSLGSQNWWTNKARSNRHCCLGPLNWWRKVARSHCHFYSSNRLASLTFVLDGSMHPIVLD